MNSPDPTPTRPDLRSSPPLPPRGRRGGTRDRGERFNDPTSPHPALACAKHAAADLVFLDRLEQGAEIAFAEALIALALNEFEEDRPEHGAGENLQQHLG